MVFLPKLAEYVQAPGISLPNEAENGREIIGEDYETEPTTVDRPCGLENLLVLPNDDTSTVWRVSWDQVWVLPRFAFIDFQELLGDVLDATNSVSD